MKPRAPRKRSKSRACRVYHRPRPTDPSPQSAVTGKVVKQRKAPSRARRGRVVQVTPIGKDGKRVKPAANLNKRAKGKRGAIRAKPKTPQHTTRRPACGGGGGQQAQPKPVG